MSNESEALAQPVVESLREFTLRTIGCDECQEVIGKLGLFFSGAPLRRSEGFCLKPFVGHNGSPKNRGTPVCTGSAAMLRCWGCEDSDGLLSCRCRPCLLYTSDAADEE